MRYILCGLVFAFGCTDATNLSGSVPDADVPDVMMVVPDVGPDGAPLGAPCSGPMDCESGVCVGLEGGGAVCSQDCDIESATSCPDGWVCSRSPETGTDRCVPLPQGPPCAPCEEDAECGGPDDQCLPLIGQGAQRICTRDCREADCPAGFVCQEVGNARQCFPADNVCDDEVPTDLDGDGAFDDFDNCPEIANDQRDRDADGVGDACDVCPTEPDPQQIDSDMDGFGDACDVCPQVANPEQSPQDCVPLPEEAYLKAGHFTSGVTAGETGAGRTVTGGLGGQEPRPVMHSPNFRLSPISIGGNQ